MLAKLFSQISKKDASIAGGKGASLGEMIRAGFSVPDGFVVLAQTFEKFLDETDLNVEIQSQLGKINFDDLSSVEKTSKAIRDLIDDKNIPEEISDEILRKFKKLDCDCAAVRSSATAEDSSIASWAGELDSFLNTTEEKLLENIKKCWMSLFTPRAIFYRNEKGLLNTKISVAVIIQKMVQSEVSGICFTVHPVTEDRSQMVIEAGYGLGEAIVGGMITPDTYIISKIKNQKSKISELNLPSFGRMGLGGGFSYQILDKNISQQKLQIIRGENGTIESQVPESKQEKQRLSDEKILELAEICQKIEDHYGCPQDIEWALEKEKLYILQARPITTLKTNEIIQDETDDILNLIKNNKFYKETTHPFIPVIYFESAMRSYFENPLQKKLGIKKFPNVIEILKNNFEGWNDQNVQKITDKNQIEFIIKESRAAIKKHKEKMATILEKDYLNLENREFIKSISLIDKICMEIYQVYLFFIHEYFETEEEKLLKLLPEIRIELSDFVDKVYDCCKLFINALDNKFPEISTTILWNSSFEDLNFLLGNPSGVEEFKKRINTEAIIFVYDNKNLHVIKEQERIKEIINVLERQEQTIEFVGEIKGNIISKGRVKAKVIKISELEYEKIGEILKNKKDFILVVPMTRPEFVPYLKNCKATITDEGGITCHAAIVSRELKIPCIVGTKIATQVLKDGDFVEVDANEGIVRILESAAKQKQ